MSCTKCSINPAVQDMLERTAELGIDTVFDRFEQQQPQCGFGQLGLCCSHCGQGPCRINPFG